MKPELTTEQAQIVEAVAAICDRFDDNYWLGKERRHEFPYEFRDAMAEGGWLGITMPEEFGGAGLGVTEAALMMQTIANSAGAISACSSMLPRIAPVSREMIMCFIAERVLGLPKSY